MKGWTGTRIARVLGTASAPDTDFSSIATDTRQLTDGALFVALVGERFDGHDFLESARESGATGAVVRRGTTPISGLHCFEVDDTLVALGHLARDHRDQFDGPVVAVTGTNGKTSVKEMLIRALSTRWQVHATRQNRNNLVGVPLTLLEATPSCQALVVEAGASEPGELARLREIIEPSITVITNVAEGHLQGFGSLQGVLAEKVSLADGVPVAVVGTEPQALAQSASEVSGRVIVAGVSEGAAVRPDQCGVDSRGYGWLSFGGSKVVLPLLGRHQLDNAMLVLAVAQELGLDIPVVSSALRGVSLPAGRCELVTRGDLVILQDTYNANPGSLAALLATAEAMRNDRPLVIVLGTMLELGSDSSRLHARMADAVMAAKPAMVAVLGEFVPAFEPYKDILGDRLLVAEDADGLGRDLAGWLNGNELVLIKGSRGVRMERAVPHLIPD
ncbi:MAG: UDP-N-acetylmuramoyl-tripeptide--D-alanyl-D-alanine ligase [Gemmatimonadota bacterium]|nr:MAG: UDP-N-acetylmuramoyl-tripeptide--D-alanyl-D-alanine ligase [Gemmatimonadota bacterium]